jgi:hypothetical protein
MFNLLIFVMLSSLSVLAFTPKNFSLPSTIGGTAVFVDFTEAKYILTYDVENKKATYKTIINFKQNTIGKPLFDVVQKPKIIKLNNEFLAEQEVFTPNNETKVRVLDKVLPAGNYSLTIEGDITNLVKFDNSTVSAAHWTSDLSDRSYLENYLPTNLEYDQYKMIFEVEVKGTSKPHKIYANGIVEKLDNGFSFKVTYPNYFTASSGFYHLTPADAFNEVKLNFSSISGKNIPVVIYGKASSTNFEAYSSTTLNTLKELEADYGPFLHNSVVIYNSGRGGMEYCGATMTEFYALEHELTHSYFARGLIPANGNAGWIDEAIASWRDNKYPRRSTMTGSSQMSSRAYYTRQTDRQAYTYGASFISYLDGKLASNVDADGIKSFLKHARENHSFKPYTVEMFIAWMEEFYDYKLSHDFQTYTYGQTQSMHALTPMNSVSTPVRDVLNSHPVHKKLSLKELYLYL